MPTHLATETRVITLTVSDMPDLPSWDGKLHIIPATVEITYRWEHPDHRDDWYQPGQVRITVTGPRRLKSGGAGQQITSVFHEHGGRPRPDWLTELVNQHMPEGWNR
jgi:hypothetical protein